MIPSRVVAQPVCTQALLLSTEKSSCLWSNTTKNINYNISYSIITTLVVDSNNYNKRRFYASIIMAMFLDHAIKP